MSHHAVSPMIGSGATKADAIRPEAFDAPLSSGESFWIVSSNQKPGVWRGEWQAGQSYSRADIVCPPGAKHHHWCNTDHVSSGTWPNALSAGYWDAVEAVVTTTDESLGGQKAGRSLWLGPETANQAAERVGFGGTPSRDPKELAHDLASHFAGRPLRMDPGPPHADGTFSDDFGAARYPTQPVNLSSHADWELVGGNANRAVVDGNELTFPQTSSGYAMHRCPDQGATNNYTQYTYTGTANGDGANAGMRATTRVVDANNCFGLYHEQNPLALYMYCFVNAGWNSLGTWMQGRVNGEVLRIEVNNDDFEAFSGGINRIGPVNDTRLTGNTRQGLMAGGEMVSGPMDDYAAGALGPGPSFQAAWARQSTVGDGFVQSS